MVEGISDIKCCKMELCESCVNGKMTRLSFGNRTKAKRILEIVHLDVCGPTTLLSNSGNKYFVTFIEDYSIFVCVYPIKSKADVFPIFVEYIQMAQAKFNKKVSNLGVIMVENIHLMNLKHFVNKMER